MRTSAVTINLNERIKNIDQAISMVPEKNADWNQKQFEYSDASL